ncbi:hypothetical protein [Streptomyces sp. GC420]|nr:hypothetical protein [Streptomyces sp. GC420]
MRRETVRRPVRKTGSRRVREDAEQIAERPEVRKDIRRIWWPES